MGRRICGVDKNKKAGKVCVVCESGVESAVQTSNVKSNVNIVIACSCGEGVDNGFFLGEPVSGVIN